jgi:hypothetical protein
LGFFSDWRGCNPGAYKMQLLQELKGRTTMKRCNTAQGCAVWTLTFYNKRMSCYIFWL